MALMLQSRAGLYRFSWQERRLLNIWGSILERRSIIVLGAVGKANSIRDKASLRQPISSVLERCGSFSFEVW